MTNAMIAVGGMLTMLSVIVICAAILNSVRDLHTMLQRVERRVDSVECRLGMIPREVSDMCMKMNKPAPIVINKQPEPDFGLIRRVEELEDWMEHCVLRRKDHV